MKHFFLVLLISISTFIHGHKISVHFREPLSGRDQQILRQVIAVCKEGEHSKIGIVIKRNAVVIQGAKAPLHTIALRLPKTLQSAHEITSKLANVMRLDADIISDLEAEKIVWDIKDTTNQNWKVFRGSHLYEASDAPSFNPHDVYDAHGNFKADIVAYFYDLPISQEERNKTYELIDMMGTEAWYNLLWHQSHLEKIGKEIDHVHPLRFTGVIFADPHLKECMREVRSFGLKWSRFIEGFSRKMTMNFAKRNVLCHLPGYCVETGGDYNTLLRLAQEQKWEAFLDHLINR